ncbi:MAG: hypothetical protein AAFY02_13065 [Pseudomonadota bacterium]
MWMKPLVPLSALLLLAACQAAGPKAPPGPLAGVSTVGVIDSEELDASQVAAPCDAAENLVATARDGQIRGHRLVALAEACVRRGSKRDLGQAFLGYGLQQIGKPREGLQALKNLLGFPDSARVLVQPGGDLARVLGHEARSYFYAASARWPEATADLDRAIEAQTNADAVVTGALLARRGFYETLEGDGLAAQASFDAAAARWQTAEGASEIAFEKALGDLGRARWDAAASGFDQVFRSSGSSYRRAQAALLGYLADAQVALLADQPIGAARNRLDTRLRQSAPAASLAPFAELLQGRVGPEAALGVAEQNALQNVEASRAQAYLYIGIYHLLRGERDLAGAAWSRGLSTRVTTLPDYLLMQGLRRAQSL